MKNRQKNVDPHADHNHEQNAELLRKSHPASLAVERAAVAVLGFAHGSSHHARDKIHAHEDHERGQCRIPAADARTRGRMLFEGERYADIGYEVGSSVAMKPPTRPATVQMVSFIFISPFLKWV